MDSVGLCAFCKQDGNPSVVGSTFSAQEWTVHENCLYFSSGLAQSEDASSGDGGLCGFSMKDVLRELRRGNSIKCCGCHKPGGYVGCAVRHCHKAGHFPCLYNSGFCFRYGEQFEAYCAKHRPTQPPLDKVDRECCICLTELQPSHSPEQIYCPSCFTTFHRSCIEQQALSAGLHYFRCPVCNSKDKYSAEMFRMGVAIPDRDASWEVGTDYAVEEYKYCHVATCLCPHGRTHYTQIGKYRMRKCCTCGQWRGHVECLRGDSTSECDDCWTASQQLSKQRLLYPEQTPSDCRYRTSGRKQTVTLTSLLNKQPVIVLTKLHIQGKADQ